MGTRSIFWRWVPCCVPWFVDLWACLVGTRQCSSCALSSAQTDVSIVPSSCCFEMARRWLMEGQWPSTSNIAHMSSSLWAKFWLSGDARQGSSEKRWKDMLGSANEPWLEDSTDFDRVQIFSIVQRKEISCSSMRSCFSYWRTAVMKVSLSRIMPTALLRCFVSHAIRSRPWTDEKHSFGPCCTALLLASCTLLFLSDICDLPYSHV